MLSSSVETYHLDQFKLALSHLEAFDIEEVEWKIDQVNILRSKDETGKLNTVVSWGELGYIDDWFLERVEIKAGNWSPSPLREVITGKERSQLQVYTLYAIAVTRELSLGLVAPGSLKEEDSHLSILGLDL